MKYVRYRGVRVSKKWYVVLKAAEHAGYRFTLNSGKRTIAEQWRLFRQNMRWNGWRWVRRTGRPLTAYPSPTAPHVRIGRADHALDLDRASSLAHFLRIRGAHVTFPVPGESWHLEINRQDLTRLWREYR